MSLNIENLTKIYRKGAFAAKRTTALQDVSCSMQPGMVFALVGQNGAGKTTFIKCLLNLIKYDNGSITMDGAAISELIDKQKVGFMPEQLLFPRTFTIDEYLQNIMKLRGFDKSFYCERYDSYSEQLFLDEHSKKHLGELSKGTSKKVAFLQAVLHVPQLIVLDEPTDGLDPVSRRVMLQIIKELKKEGCTILISTHLLSDLEIVADEILFLQQGKLKNTVQVGSMNQSAEEWYFSQVFSNEGMKI